MYIIRVSCIHLLYKTYTSIIMVRYNYHCCRQNSQCDHEGQNRMWDRFVGGYCQLSPLAAAGARTQEAND